MKNQKGIISIYPIVLALAIFALVIAFMIHQTGCKKPYCCFQDLETTVVPSSITVSAGASVDVNVSLQAALSNCSGSNDISYSVEVNGNNPGDISGSVSSGYLDAQYSANCSIRISVPPYTTPGTYEIELLSQATIENISVDDNIIVDAGHLWVEVTEKQGDFSITAPSSFEVVCWLGMYTETVTVNRTDGHDVDIYLTAENVPENVYIGFNPGLLVGTASTSELKLQGYHDAVPGVYDVTIKANDGSQEKTHNLSLTISQALSIALSQGTISVEQGDTASIDISISRHVSFQEDIELNIYGSILGSGTNQIYPEFSVEPVVFPATSSVLIIYVGSDVPIGLHHTGITAWSNNYGGHVTVDLDITVN